LPGCKERRTPCRLRQDARPPTRCPPHALVARAPACWRASAGLRTLIVWNLGPQEEACSYQVVLTTPAGAARDEAVREAGAEMVKKRRPRTPND